jgi:hypothetical protein
LVTEYNVVPSFESQFPLDWKLVVIRPLVENEGMEALMLSRRYATFSADTEESIGLKNEPTLITAALVGVFICTVTGGALATLQAESE